MATTTPTCPDCRHSDTHSPVIGCLHEEAGDYCPCTTRWTPEAQPGPVLPYAGTSGWSGSTASRERAETADSDGTTKGRQAAALTALGLHKERGMTWKELGQYLGVHHGIASGVLSVLHKAGKIDRLAGERRLRCSVYVLPEHVQGRPTAPYGGKPKHADLNVPATDRLVISDTDAVESYLAPAPTAHAASLAARREDAVAIVAKHMSPLSLAPSYTVLAAAGSIVDDLIALGA